MMGVTGAGGDALWAAGDGGMYTYTGNCCLVLVVTNLVSGVWRATAAWRAGWPARATARAQAANETRVGPTPYG